MLAVLHRDGARVHQRRALPCWPRLHQALQIHLPCNARRRVRRWLKLSSSIQPWSGGQPEASRLNLRIATRMSAGARSKSQSKAGEGEATRAKVGRQKPDTDTQAEGRSSLAR